MLARACAVEIKPGTLRAPFLCPFRRAYGLPYKIATCIHVATKWLFNTVNCSRNSQNQQLRPLRFLDTVFSNMTLFRVKYFKEHMVLV